jgi:hypothetical protein
MDETLCVDPYDPANIDPDHKWSNDSMMMVEEGSNDVATG